MTAPREKGQFRILDPCISIFQSEPKALGTICVLGAPRGGTSMIAGLLRKLGLPMGESLDEANNEDLEFTKHGGLRAIFFKPERAAEKEKYLTEMRAVIQRRNRSYSWWGWKDPISSYYVADLISVLRNPRFIFITRDPIAIAEREWSAEGTHHPPVLLDYMKFLFKAYGSTVEFLIAQRQPTLLASYERSLRFPRKTAQAVADFVGVRAEPDFLAWAEAYIAPDRPSGSIESSWIAPTGQTLFEATAAFKTLMSTAGGASPALPVGLAEKNGASTQLVSDYSEAAAALNNGLFPRSRELCESILRRYASEHPSLHNGAAGVLAEQIIGTSTQGEAGNYPDPVGGALYMLGMCNLQTQRPQEALLHFFVAGRAMRSRLAAGNDCMLAQSLYWVTRLHEAMAAKALCRADIIVEIADEFEAALTWDDQRKAAFGGANLLETAYRRMAKEILP